MVMRLVCTQEKRDQNLHEAPLKGGNMTTCGITEEEIMGKLCIACSWCCTYANIPIPFNEGFNTQEEFAYLYWIKGRKVYWEPFTKEWYWLADAPCQHLTKDGCDCYEIRPDICKRSWCPFGPYRMHERYDLLVQAGDRIMKRIHDRGIYS